MQKNGLLEVLNNGLLEDLGHYVTYFGGFRYVLNSKTLQVSLA